MLQPKGYGNLLFQSHSEEMSATSLPERDRHDRPWGQSAPRLPASVRDRSVWLEHKRLGSNTICKEGRTYDPCSVHLPSSAWCMATAQELPHYPEGSQCVCVCVCVCWGEGCCQSKSRGGKDKPNTEEVWCDCHSHCHVFLHQQHRAQSRTPNWDLIQHQKANWSQKAPNQSNTCHFHQTCLKKPKSSASIGLWKSKAVGSTCVLVSLWADPSCHSSPCSSCALRVFLLPVLGYLVIYDSLLLPETRSNRSQLLEGTPDSKSVLH